MRPSACQLWSKPLVDGGVGVVLFNRGETAVHDWAFALADVGLKPTAAVAVRDLWAHADNATSAAGKVTAGTVARHGVAALRLTPHGLQGEEAGR